MENEMLQLGRVAIKEVHTKEFFYTQTEKASFTLLKVEPTDEPAFFLGEVEYKDGSSLEEGNYFDSLTLKEWLKHFLVCLDMFNLEEEIEYEVNQEDGIEYIYYEGSLGRLLINSKNELQLEKTSGINAQ